MWPAGQGRGPPSTLLISRQVAASPKAAIPDHSCFEIPLALYLSPEFACASQEEPARVDLALESRALAGSSDKHSGHALLLLPLTAKLRWAVPITPVHPSPWPSHLQGVRSTSQSNAKNHRFLCGTSHPSKCKCCHSGLRSQHAVDTSLTQAPMALESQASLAPSCTLPDKPAAAVTLPLYSCHSPLGRKHMEQGCQPGAGL